MNKHKRYNLIQEATGRRVVGMYVEEFFGWGWLLNTQQNDDGIDGFIHVRNKSGQDLGVRIQVQIKCGITYFKGLDDKGRLKLQIYTPKQNLKEHLINFQRQTEPTILVFVTSEWEQSKNLYKPWAWWLRLDNYQYDGSSYLYIDHKQRFGEHSKKELFNLVSNSLKWTDNITLEATQKELKLFNTIGNIKSEAKKIYSQLTAEDIKCPALYNERVYFNRIGWHHITNGQRGKGRIKNSLELIAIVPRIIKNVEKWVFARRSKNANSNHKFFTLRANVVIKKERLKVQVIVRRQKDKNGNIKFIFYSVHIINKN